MLLKSQKLDLDFKKANEKSKIRLKSSFDLSNEHLLILIDLLKELFASLKVKDSDKMDVKGVESLESNVTNKNGLLAYETAHIKRKNDFNRMFRQLSFSNNLLLFSVIALIKDHFSKKNDHSDKVENENVEENEKLEINFEALGLVSKLAFLNTNMNSNWKIDHLRNFFASLLIFEGFYNIKQSLESKETEGQETEVESLISQKSSLSLDTAYPVMAINKAGIYLKPFNLKENLKRLGSTDISKMDSAIKDNDLTIEDLKLNFFSKAVIGLCDNSSLQFGIEDLIDDSNQTETSNEKLNKQSLKLLEDCLSKLSKFDANSKSNSNIEESSSSTLPNKISSSRFSQLIPVKQSSCKPIRAAIKAVSSALIVLCSRELLILFVNLSNKLNDLNHPKNTVSILELNCHTEYEFLQLLDILYYSDNLSKYKLFIKNLIQSLSEKVKGEDEETSIKSETKSKILSKMSLMACDFMIPEFKLIKKVTWSSEDKREYDKGILKNKISNDSLIEENVNLSSSHLAKKLTDIESSNNLTSKPNDIEKLSTSDSSTLFILFDTQHNTKKQAQALPTASSTKINTFLKSISNSNPKAKKLRLNKFLKDSHLLSSESFKNLDDKYLFSDDFENEIDSKLAENDSDTESVDSIIDTANKTSSKIRFENKRGCNLVDAADSYLIYRKKEKIANDDDEESLGSNQSYSDYDLDSDFKQVNLKKSKNTPSKCSLVFHVHSERRDSSYDSNNEDYDEHQDNNEDENEDGEYDEDEDNDDDYSHDSSSSTDENDTGSESEKHSVNDDNEYSADDWYTSVNDTGVLKVMRRNAKSQVLNFLWTI